MSLQDCSGELVSVRFANSEKDLTSYDFWHISQNNQCHRVCINELTYTF